MQQDQQQLASELPPAIASFVARLSSLNAHELRCLYADNELMRQLNETQILMENKLKDIHEANSRLQAKYSIQRHQQQPPQPSIQTSNLQSPLDLNLCHTNHSQQQQEQLLASLSPIANGQNQYYNEYYLQELTMAHLAQMQHRQQQQQQQQHYQLSSETLANHALLDQMAATHRGGSANQQLAASISSWHQQQQQHQHHHQLQLHTQLQRIPGMATNPLQPALDLRTTPTRPMSDSGSAGGSSSTSRVSPAVSNTSSNGGSGGKSSHQHPKKAKLTEYCQMYQSSESSPITTTANSHKQADNQHPVKQESSERLSFDELDEIHDQNRRPSRCKQQQQQQPTTGPDLVSGQTNELASRRPIQGIRQQQPVVPITRAKAALSTTNSNSTTSTGKKYKGEFDEPSPEEVSQRERELDRPLHYHKQALEKGECACVLGSEFRDKTSRDVLEMIENWRLLNVEQRIKWKWDVGDLPKDIPLSDIKKFEDLRREFSDGKADFGGASKRKPLGIRGTRQFLLILYCLWGHPGRDDPMQRDGFCPHCFAKIKKANEQSTLVRVVNHFNMKHRRGANPRLSPQLEQQSQASCIAAIRTNSSTKTTATTTATTTNETPASQGTG